MNLVTKMGLESFYSDKLAKFANEIPLKNIDISLLNFALSDILLYLFNTQVLDQESKGFLTVDELQKLMTEGGRFRFLND